MPGIGVAIAAFGASLSLAAALAKTLLKRKADKQARRIKVTLRDEDGRILVDKTVSLSRDQVSALLELVDQPGKKQPVAAAAEPS